MKEVDNTATISNPYPYGFFAHQYLCEALEHAQDIHLCTVGEYKVIRRFYSLSVQSQQTYAQLLTREKRVLRWDKIVELSAESEKIIKELCASQFLRTLPIVNNFDRFSLYSKSELLELCKVYAISKKGKKNDVIRRLLDTDAKPPKACVLCYSSIFSRFFRKLFLQCTINWSQPVVASLYSRRQYVYEITPNIIHQTRRQYRLYRFFHRLYTEQNKYIDFSPPPPDNNVPYRFRASRFHRKYLYLSATELEKKEPLLAIELYQQLLPDFSSLQRLLTLHKSLNEPFKIYSATKEYIKEAPLSEAIALYKSLGPLCRKYKYRKGLPPVFQEARQRIIYKNPVDKGPRFEFQGTHLTIEEFIIKKINHEGGFAFFAENGFWNNLLTILFSPVLFSKTGSQFPSAYQSAPMDLYSPHFYMRRQLECEELLEQIGNGEAWSIFQKHLPNDDVFIMGQQLHNLNTKPFELLFQNISSESLSKIMRYLLQNPKFSGMPDVLAFFPTYHDCSFLTPSDITTTMMFVEAKSHSDTMRPNQYAMHHLLLTSGVHVEVWKQKSFTR